MVPLARCSVIVVSGLLGCAPSSEPQPSDQGAALAAGEVARIGRGTAIVAETVRRVAVTQNVEPRRALELAVHDALMAEQAREQLSGTGRVSAAERAILARALLEHLQQQARAEGPPTNDELAAMTRERWYDYDRPESARTTHAVVRVLKPEQKEAARALAERVADAVRGETDPQAFIEKASALATDGLEIRAERLPAVTADGRTVPKTLPGQNNPPGQFDRDFARAANALTTVGQQSPIVETRFGYHVILLEERLPAQRRTVEELGSELAEDVVARRARELQRELLERARAQTGIEKNRAALELTARVRVGE